MFTCSPRAGGITPEASACASPSLRITAAYKPVDAGYILAGNKVRLHLGKYDHNRTLVIDPVFTYLTYLGGSSVDRIGSVTAVGQVSSITLLSTIDISSV